MKFAINQIKQLIQKHENDLDAHLKVLEELDVDEFIIEHTKRIYSECIDELHQAITIIENAVA